MFASQAADSSRIARKVAIVACAAVFALLALGSGLDRIAQARPALAPHVPAPFASQALRSAGREALARGDAAASLKLGKAAVVDAPVEPESTALLGMARLAAGDRSGGERAFRVAGQLGWRVPYTQAYWMDRALAVGDYRVAAMRLDAMLRQQPELLANRALLDPLEQAPAGRAALAERLMTAPGWLVPYSTQVTGLARDVLLQRAQVLGEVARRGGSTGCEAIAPLVEQLVDAQAVAEGSALWRQHCPGATQTMVHDGNFVAAMLEQDRSQFTWTFIGQGDASALFEPAPNPPAKLLAIDSTALYPRLIARQLVLAGPGRYRLTWLAIGADGGPSDLALAAFACTPDPKDWLSARFDATRHRWIAEFTIDGSCAARWLGFGIAPRPGNVKLGQIALERIG